MRVALTPVFYYFLINHRVDLGVAIFIIVAVTDLADGHIARKYNLQTKFGQALDPFADKFMVAFAMIAIVQAYEFPVWAILPFLSRDIISVLGSIIYVLKKSKSEWKPNALGKLTTLSQVVTIVGYFISSTAKEEALGFTIAFSIAASIGYGIRIINYFIKTADD